MRFARAVQPFCCSGVVSSGGTKTHHAGRTMAAEAVFSSIDAVTSKLREAAVDAPEVSAAVGASVLASGERRARGFTILPKSSVDTKTSLPPRERSRTCTRTNLLQARFLCE